MESNTQKTGGNNLPMVITVVGLIGLIGLFIYRSGMPNDTNPESVTVNTTTTDQDTGREDAESMDATEQGTADKVEVMINEVVNNENTDSEDKMEANVVKEFTVSANNFKYDVTEIKVNQGDTVKINFVNDEGFHDWVLDEFNAKTKQLNAGEKETIEFVADKTGTYEYYCSVGKHREMGMVGNLIVE
jgi:plastocyanin